VLYRCGAWRTIGLELGAYSGAFCAAAQIAGRNPVRRYTKIAEAGDGSSIELKSAVSKSFER
jgi:hypothetical protein